MPATLKIEQKRFVDTVALYCENTEEESVNVSATPPPAPVGGGMPGGAIPGAANVKANKTAASKKTTYGKATVSKPAMKNLKKPNNQRT